MNRPPRTAFLLNWSAPLPSVARRKAAGFTRVDLVIVLSVLGLLAGIALPVLANTKPRSERVTCFNNLRQVNVAWLVWAGDHNDRSAWHTFVGASGPGLKGANAWEHYQVVSNELASPRILVCPSDTKKTADNFSMAPGGLGWLGYQDNAVSYFVGVDAFIGTTRSLVSGDRHFGGNGVRYGVGCAYLPFLSVAAELRNVISSQIRWTSAVHGPDYGNLALSDGSVRQTSTKGFQQAIQTSDDASDNNHVLPVHPVP